MIPITTRAMSRYRYARRPEELLGIPCVACGSTLSIADRSPDGDLRCTSTSQEHCQTRERRRANPDAPRAWRGAGGHEVWVARFWANVDQSAGATACWQWTGHLNRVGYGTYGRLGHGPGSRLAHRIAYELAVGPIPVDQYVCHHCDNPSCCNPAHLYVGTAADNSRDARERGRLRSRVLTADQVRAIRERFAASETAVALAQIYGVSAGSVQNVVTRKTWASVP